MTDIYHQIGVKAEISDVYRALTTQDGLSNWWTETTGGISEGDVLTFHFGEHTVKMTITLLNTNRTVRWQCTVDSGEWKDTYVSFELLQTPEQVFINFAHTDWAAQTELCAHCNTKWAVFLLSLKDYLERGKGKPFPHDTHINHTDF